MQAEIISLPTSSASEVEERVRHAICEYLHPVHGGRDRRGWPFGRHIRASEITAELAQIAGVDVVEDVQLIRRSSSGGDERGEIIELYPMELPLPVTDHEVQVRQS